MSTTDFLTCKILTQDTYQYACMSKEKNYKKNPRTLSSLLQGGKYLFEIFIWEQ